MATVVAIPATETVTATSRLRAMRRRRSCRGMGWFTFNSCLLCDRANQGRGIQPARLTEVCEESAPIPTRRVAAGCALGSMRREAKAVIGGSNGERSGVGNGTGECRCGDPSLWKSPVPVNGAISSRARCAPGDDHDRVTRRRIPSSAGIRLAEVDPSASGLYCADIPGHAASLAQRGRGSFKECSRGRPRRSRIRSGTVRHPVLRSGHRRSPYRFLDRDRRCAYR